MIVVESIRISSTRNISACREVFVEEDDIQRSARPSNPASLCYLKSLMKLQLNLQPESSFHIYRFIVKSIL